MNGPVLDCWAHSFLREAESTVSGMAGAGGSSPQECSSKHEEGNLFN